MSVLTVVTRPTGSVALVRLGFRIARATEDKLVVLCLARGAAGGPRSFVPGDELPADADPAVVEVCGALERRGAPVELQPDEDPAAGEPLLEDPEVEVRWLRTSRRLRTVLKQAAEVGAAILVAAEHRPARGQPRVSLARKLFTAAPCHILLTHPGSSEENRLRRVLVPTAGGPHAQVALRLGERLASAGGGEVVALYVTPDEGELPRAVGERILARIVTEAGVASSPALRGRVELGSDRLAAISTVAAEGSDLLLIGESNVGTLRRSLFGTVPQNLLRGAEGMTVAVVRREWKLLHRLRRRLGRWLDLTIPQMDRQQRTTLYERLQSGSEWNFDFMTLTSLSTAIAALGLLQSSAAVVIGAMLVAPLMTPILGAGLALVQGNLPLLRAAAHAIAFGYLIALGIGLGAGFAFSIPQLTPELLARGGPTLLDMGVAFLSGLAAAFCLGRPGLLAALPGVAIAAALVPPIATTGISLALGESRNASGAALLFGTNVIAIILGAAVSFYAGGVRGKRGASSRQRWVRWAYLVLFLGAAVLLVPLGSERAARPTAEEQLMVVSPELHGRLAAYLEEEHPGARLLVVEGRREDGGSVVEVRLGAPAPPASELATGLARIVRQELGEGQVVRVRTELAVEVLPKKP